MAEELDNTIRENAARPKRARGDSGEIRLSAERLGLLDLLEKAMDESRP